MTQKQPGLRLTASAGLHNGLRNTTGLVMVQLVILNMKEREKGLNEGNVVIQFWKSIKEHLHTAMMGAKKLNNGSVERKRQGKKRGMGQRSKDREKS